MSELRPYSDYVRAGDTFTVSLLVTGYPLGVSQNAVFAYLQTHNLQLTDWNDSQWGYVSGGPIRLWVLALTDFAHVADVADAVAQSFGDAGYSPGIFSNWNQSASRAYQVPDSVSREEATAGIPGLRNTGGPVSDALVDELSNVPRNVSQGVQNIINDDILPTATSPLLWIAVALVVVVIVLPKISGR